MKRTSAMAFVLLAVCTLAGCASTPTATKSSARADRRTGDSLGHAIFGSAGASDRIARADRDR